LIFSAVITLALGLAQSVRAQNVGVSTATPDNSALLDLETTSLGLLPPRLTNTQMLAVTTPATGDLVFNSTYSTYYYYNGSFWVPLIGSGWSLTGNSGTSTSTNFLGTIDAEDLVQKTKSVEHLRVYNGGGVGLTNSNNSAEKLYFYEASGLGSLYNAFRAGIQSTTVHYIWPLGGDGLPDQALVTDGAGNLSWHTFTTFNGSPNQILWLRGSAAGGEYSDSTGSSDSGPYSITAGYLSTVTGNYEMVFGDSTSGVSGSYGDVNGGSGNSSTGNLDVSGGGQDNTAEATASYIGGGASNTTSGNEEVVLGGRGATFSGSNSTILGGSANKCGSNYQLIYGLSNTDALTGSVVFKIGTHTLMGIGTNAPTQAMDIKGNLKFSGALKPNNTGGSSGQYLLSAGAGSPPTWGGATFLSTNWKLLGTSGTAPATNYVGTADAQDFVIRTNATERMRVTSGGNVGIGTTTPAHKVASIFPSTTDETAAGYGEASGATANQAVGVWGIANTSSSNTGTISALGTGNGNTTAGTTNAAVQISQGEFTMGRTTQTPSKGTVVEGAASGTLYSQQGPSGVIQLSLLSDLGATPPTAGLFQDLGTLTISNQFINANSIIVADVVSKVNSASDPYTKNSMYKVDVESSTTGSCVLHIGMIPFVSDTNAYVSADYIRVGYCVINPGR
jgi:hypothetical protein